jgi:hypothetical protein
MNSTKAASIFSSMLWATAIVASKLLKAPPFLTSMLLPLLGFASLATILMVGRSTRTFKGAPHVSNDSIPASSVRRASVRNSYGASAGVSFKR